MADSLWEDVDYARRKKACHLRLLRGAAKPCQDEVRRLRGIPGIDIVIACTLVAYLEGGYRFRNKRKLWRYSNLSVRRRESGNKGIESASKEGNRILKNAVFIAVTSIAGSKDNALRWMAVLQSSQHIDGRRVRRNMARKVLVIAQRLLRSGEEYCDEYLMSTLDPNS